MEGDTLMKMVKAENIQPVFLKNKIASACIEPDGGAITDFHLESNRLNPLTFSFSKADMPPNNRNGAPYRGHFSCIGRWGPPSEGERKLGMPDHGDFANILWDVTENNFSDVLMEAKSDREGLTVHRKIRLDEESAVFLTSESLTNHQHLGRLYNIVQHPTIAQPFLTPETRIFCNAEKGVHYELYKEPERYSSTWPAAIFPGGSIQDISYSDRGCSGVHSFIVKRNDHYGWIAAFSPVNSLLFGYVWRRKDYPWINHWCDFNGNRIRYRGLEFGTSGIHQPFREILETGHIRIFGEPVFEYIDAEDTVTKQYLCFLHIPDKPITGIESIIPGQNSISIATSESGTIQIPLAGSIAFNP